MNKVQGGQPVHIKLQETVFHRPSLDALNSFETALTWPETQQRVEALFKRGLQRDGDFEKRWTEVLGTLLEK